MFCGVLSMFVSLTSVMESVAATLTQLTHAIGSETDYVYRAYIIEKQTGVEVCWRVADVSLLVEVLGSSKVVGLGVCYGVVK